MLPDSSDSVQTKKNYNQRVLFEEPAGKCRETIAQPQTEDCRKFCSKPWDKPVQFKEDAEWLVKV